MSRMEDVAFKGPNLSQVTTGGANAAAVATIPAPGAGLRVYVTGYTVSYSLAIAAAVVPDVVSGAVVVDRMQVPAAAVAPISIGFSRAFECPVNTSCVGTAPAGGASNVATMIIRYFIA